MKQLLRDKRGLSAVEYGLIATVIVVLVIAGISLVGSNLSGEFSSIATDV